MSCLHNGKISSRYARIQAFRELTVLRDNHGLSTLTPSKQSRLTWAMWQPDKVFVAKLKFENHYWKVLTAYLIQPDGQAP